MLFNIFYIFLNITKYLIVLQKYN